MGSNFINALRLLEEKAAKTYLSTGCPELDDLLGGGIEPGVFHLFYGDAESGVDLFIHQLMANALGAEEGTGRIIYLTCGNYREEKTIFNIPVLIRFLKRRKLDVRACLERVLVFCAFSAEQQEQVVGEIRQTIDETREIKLLVVHHIAKLFTTQRSAGEDYRKIPRLQRIVSRLWQTCATQGVAIVASCKPNENKKSAVPRPAGGRYLSHEANVIVYLRKVGGLFPAPHAYLIKHFAKPPGTIVLHIHGEKRMGRITVPFKKRFEEELESLKDFRDALKDLTRQAAYDQIIQVCTSEQGALANANIPAVLDAMLLSAAVDNRRYIDDLLTRVHSLEADVHKLKSQSRIDRRINE